VRRDPDFHRDMDRLIEGLNPIIADSQPKKVARTLHKEKLREKAPTVEPLAPPTSKLASEVALKPSSKSWTSFLSGLRAILNQFDKLPSRKYRNTKVAYGILSGFIGALICWVFFYTIGMVFRNLPELAFVALTFLWLAGVALSFRYGWKFFVQPMRVFIRNIHKNIDRMLSDLHKQYPNEMAEIGDIDLRNPSALLDVVLELERFLASEHSD
jgi:hypothetical protein